MISFFTIVLIGIIAGAAMAGWAMMMHMSGISKMNMSSIQGCMITGQSSGMLSFFAGMSMHFILSIAIAFIYTWVIDYLQIPLVWYQGLFFGLLHWLIVGIMLPLMDKMNICIAQVRILPLKAYAYGYGSGAAFTFFIGHLIYGLVVCTLLSLWIR